MAAGGGQANQREGGNTLGVGSYILRYSAFDRTGFACILSRPQFTAVAMLTALDSLGGMQAGQPATAVEIFDPRRPRTGWRAGRAATQ